MYLQYTPNRCNKLYIVTPVNVPATPNACNILISYSTASAYHVISVKVQIVSSRIISMLHLSMYIQCIKATSVKVHI